jgi:hypothetical protein
MEGCVGAEVGAEIAGCTYIVYARTPHPLVPAMLNISYVYEVNKQCCVCCIKKGTGDLDFLKKL